MRTFIIGYIVFASKHLQDIFHWFIPVTILQYGVIVRIMNKGETQKAFREFLKYISDKHNLIIFKATVYYCLMMLIPHACMHARTNACTYTPHLYHGTHTYTDLTIPQRIYQEGKRYYSFFVRSNSYHSYTEMVVRSKTSNSVVSSGVRKLSGLSGR